MKCSLHRIVLIETLIIQFWHDFQPSAYFPCVLGKSWNNVALSEIGASILWSFLHNFHQFFSVYTRVASQLEWLSGSPSLTDGSPFYYSHSSVYVHCTQAGHIGRTHHPLLILNLVHLLPHLYDLELKFGQISLQVGNKLTNSQPIANREGIWLPWKQSPH